jgi:glycosyltransferase involved in cell wall biosynthesis
MGGRRILILSDHAYFPDRVGGRESSIHELAEELVTSGRHPVVLARQSKSRSLLRHWLFRPPYRVIRQKDPLKSLEPILGSERIRTTIVNLDNSKLPHLLDRLKRDSIIYYRDTQNIENIAGRPELDSLRFVANSSFVSSRVKNILGSTAPVVPPFVRAERYRSPPGGRFVTFINPIPKKGLHVAMEIAQRLPDIPFLFVESWPLTEEKWRDLALACNAFPNITLRRRSLDMRRIYTDTRILLVPSQWEEAWGRVVTEAQVSGIPAIASQTGGLPEAVGEAGIVLPPEASADLWAENVRACYGQAKQWEQFSRQAGLQFEKYARFREDRYAEFFNSLG